MEGFTRNTLTNFAALAIVCSLAAVVSAQDRGIVLTPTELARIML